MRSKRVHRKFAWVIVCLLSFGIAASVLLAADPPTTRPVDYFGLVVGPDNKPVANARVMLTQPEQATGGYAVVASATTAVDGRFQFTGADPQAAQCIVQAKGLGLGGGILMDSTKDDPAEIQLARATELHLKFEDSTGNVIAGLSVFPTYVREPIAGAQSAMLPKEPFTKTTDASGECVFADMPQGSYFYFEIGDDRFARPSNAAVRLTPKPITDGGTIHLDIGSSIEGRITYGDSGKPAAGIVVSAQGRVEDQYFFSGTSLPTDANGKYQIKNLAAANYEVNASLTPQISAQYAISSLEAFALAAGEKIAGKDMTLINGGIVQGKVVASGAPVPGAGVRAYNLAANGGAARSQAYVVSGEDGSFLMHVTPGRQAVQTTTPLPPAYIGGRGGQSVTVEDQQTVSVNLELQPNPNPALKGRVVDPDGKPVVGAMLNLQAPQVAAGGRRGGGLITTNSTMRSGADGSFNIPAVPAGTLVRGRKGQAGTAAAETVTDANRSDFTVTIRKDGLASAAVSIVDDANKPIAGADISMTQRIGNIGYSGQSGSTDDSGKFLVSALYPDSIYSISVGAKGYGIASGTLALQAGKQSDMQIKLAKAESFVGGLVLDENQLPMANVDVFVGGGRSTSQTVKTDFTGHFRANGIVAGDTVSVYTRVGTRMGQQTPERATAGTGDMILIHNPPPPTTGPAGRGILVR